MTTPSTASYDPIRAGEECLAAALDYLHRGWSPLALCPPDHVGIRHANEQHSKKCKAGSHGKAPWIEWKRFQTERPTEADIRAWWRKLPNSNLGCTLGTASGLIRVDVEGDGGNAELARLCGEEAPATVAFTSGQPGSLGLLFTIPHGVELRTKREGFKAGEHDELRLQGPGAQTVLPPSWHNKLTRYTWLPGRGPDEIAMAPMLPWMIDLMRVTAQAKSATGPRETGDGDPAEIALALAALAGLNTDRAASYDDWFLVGMALHSVDDGDAMLEAWDEWSKNCDDKYEEGACAAKWATFQRGKEGGLTLGSLIYWAKQDGWKPPYPTFGKNGQAHGANGNGQAADTSNPTNGAAPATPPHDAPASDSDGLGIILADFRERLKPRFKRGQAIFSEAEGCEIKPSEGCFAPDRPLINKLAKASDAPKNGDGNPDLKRLPKFYREWARSAWKELLNSLPEETEADEVIATAEEEFRYAIRAGLYEQITLGHEGHDPQRFSLIDWCEMFAKTGDWKQIRSYLIWCKRTVDGMPAEVAVRCELFDQIRKAKMTHRKFAALCKLYGIGEQAKTGGARAVVLTPEFLASVRETPNSA